MDTMSYRLFSTRPPSLQTPAVNLMGPQVTHIPGQVALNSRVPAKPRGSVSHWGDSQKSGKCQAWDCCFTVRTGKGEFWKVLEAELPSPVPQETECVTSGHMGVFTIQEAPLSLSDHHFYWGLGFYWIDI